MLLEEDNLLLAQDHSRSLRPTVVLPTLWLTVQRRNCVLLIDVCKLRADSYVIVGSLRFSLRNASTDSDIADIRQWLGTSYLGSAETEVASALKHKKPAICQLLVNNSVKANAPQPIEMSENMAQSLPTMLTFP